MEAKDELTARCEAATGEASHQTSRAEKAEAECASLVDLRASAESAATEALEKLQVAQEELANIKQQLEAASALAAEREEGLVAAAANGNVTKFMYSTSRHKSQVKNKIDVLYFMLTNGFLMPLNFPPLPLHISWLLLFNSRSLGSIGQ